MHTTLPERVKTAEQVKADFEARGVPISDFAREHGLKLATVYQVLNGKKKGRRGEAHRAAVLLGIKAGIAAERAA